MRAPARIGAIKAKARAFLLFAAYYEPGPLRESIEISCLTSAYESLTEEELAIFDILTRPEPELSDAEIAEVKKVAKEVLEKLKAEKLVLDWREAAPPRPA